MSDNYYFVCDKCKEAVDAGSRVGGSYMATEDMNLTIPPFVVTHAGCDAFRLVGEDADLDGYKEWTPENAASLFDLCRTLT